MLARLIATYAFATQPQVERAEAFAARVIARLEPERTVRELARVRVEAALARQRRERGIDVRMSYGW